MTQPATAAVLLAGILACGCQKESGGGGTAGGGSPLDFPADTSAIVGFNRKGPAPDAAQLKEAMKALLREEPDKEIVELTETCIAPVTAHLEPAPPATP